MTSTPSIRAVVAWGQYVHWAHIQFGHFLALTDDAPASEYAGVAAHWLAAEYVVLEGWRELGLTDSQISRLIELYPENCDALRRCRNAVYHYQNTILDERILTCLQAENEEFMWCIALHAEFQRVLVSIPFAFPGPIDEQLELSDEIEVTIGWSPKYAPFAAHLRVVRKCMHLERLYQGEESAAAENARAMIVQTLEQLQKIDHHPFLKYLNRWKVDLS